MYMNTKFSHIQRFCLTPKRTGRERLFTYRMYKRSRKKWINMRPRNDANIEQQSRGECEEWSINYAHPRSPRRSISGARSTAFASTKSAILYLLTSSLTCYAFLYVNVHYWAYCSLYMPYVRRDTKMQSYIPNCTN